MKRVFGITFLTLMLTVGALSQTTTDCPAGMACITREALVNLLKQSDENAGLKETIKAKDAQIVSRDALISTLNTEVTDFKVKWAQAVGENTELRASRVRDQAIMDILIKNARPKKIGFINLF
jgi:hypothetical protein